MDYLPLSFLTALHPYQFYFSLKFISFINFLKKIISLNYFWTLKGRDKNFKQKVLNLDEDIV